MLTLISFSKRMKKIIYLLAMFTLSSCVYPYTPDIDDSQIESSLVIDANILLGNTSTITLSYLQPLDLSHSIVYRRAKGDIYLEDSEGDKYPAVTYYDLYRIPTFPVKENVQYRLTVIADNKTYRSDWIEPTAPPEITDVNFTADNTQVYVRVSLEDHGQGSGYASASFEEIWKFHTDYVRLYGYIPETNSVYMLMYPDESHIWCWRKNILGYSYNIDYSALDGVVKDYSIFHFLRTSDRNHQEYNIRVKVWNLTPEQYRFRKILEENESIGGDLFSPEPGEVRGNVYCEDDENEKVFGYVNVSRVAMKDAKLNSRYDLWTAPKSLIEVAPEDYLDFYNNGYNPVEQIASAEGGMVVGWGLGRCYDCVLAGGTLEKPSFE